MHAVVRRAWPKFISRWEGRTSYMYCDTLGWVTFGVGRKIDDNGKISTYGLTRPWRDSKSQLVLESAIKAEFSKIKSRSDLKAKGGYAYADVASLFLADDDIDEALLDTTDAFWSVLVKTLPDLPEWPADGQLALLNMAYHMGPHFLGSAWPNFTRAARAADFAGCAESCQTSRKTPRDATNVALFTNAAVVSWADQDRSRLWGPSESPTSAGMLAELSAKAVAAADPAKHNGSAWYVQRMLAKAGHYTSVLDGKFGNLSRSALTAWTQSAKQPDEITRPVLAALSKKTIRMPVVA